MSENWHEFKSWRDIMAWAKEKEFKHLVARMELNHQCWNSSGEFGRSQVEICDSIRFAPTEEIAENIAQQMDAQMEENYGLY